MTTVADERRDGVKLIEIDQSQLRGHVDGVVRDAVEETLNALLDAEADELCGAKKYERSPERTDYRAGHYGRQFHTKAGEVALGSVQFYSHISPPAGTAIPSTSIGGSILPQLRTTNESGS